MLFFVVAAYMVDLSYLNVLLGINSILYRLYTLGEDTFNLLLYRCLGPFNYYTGRKISYWVYQWWLTDIIRIEYASIDNFGDMYTMAMYFIFWIVHMLLTPLVVVVYVFDISGSLIYYLTGFFNEYGWARDMYVFEFTRVIFFENLRSLIFEQTSMLGHSCMQLALQFGILLFILSVIALAFPNHFGLYGSYMLTLPVLFCAWLCIFLVWLWVLFTGEFFFLNGPKWFMLPGILTVTFDILIDKLSITYVMLILSIGLCVLLYTFSYFRYEPHVERLFLFINLFMISMCILVVGGNLFVIFLGWELIGLTSFFLINFWSTRIGTLKAAFKAFVFNKVSDLGLLLFIIFSLITTGESNVLILNSLFINFVDVHVQIFGISISYIEIFFFFLTVSAFIKSAQFGFHIWLPDSMEAPVPASALIHSATLVSAGVFLFLRFSHLVELSTLILNCCVLISSLTAAFGGVSACFQSDVKRILAYSTISHCGFLIFLACLGNLEVTLLYLCVHGFFKALVFMCVGNVIRFARNYQDFRYMGGFASYLPVETFLMLIGLLNLAGLPFSFGFVIKHYTLLSMFGVTNILVKINLLVGMFSSLIYSYRIYYYVFFDTKKAKKSIYFAASKHTLRSSMYSNTTIAGSLSIILLLIIATINIGFLYFCVVNNPLSVNTPIWSSNPASGLHFFTTIESMNLLGSFINVFILLLFTILFWFRGRYRLFGSNVLETISHIVIWWVCFYLLLLIF